MGLAVALSLRLRENGLKIVESFEPNGSKTKEAAAALKAEKKAAVKKPATKKAPAKKVPGYKHGPARPPRKSGPKPPA